MECEMTAAEKQIQDDAFRYACALGRLCGGHALPVEVIWPKRSDDNFHQKLKTIGKRMAEDAIAKYKTRPAAAKALGVSRTTLHRWLNI